MKKQEPYSLDIPEDVPEGWEWSRNDALHLALSRSLIKAELPLGFHTALRNQVMHEAQQNIIARREALEAERLRLLAEMRAGYIRVQRSILVKWLMIAFVSGIVAYAVLPAVIPDLETGSPASLIAFALLTAGYVTVITGKLRLPGRG